MAAVEVVLDDPGLWLLGAGGFLLRGGWLLLAVPVWTFPSPVELSTLLGAETLGTGGITPGLGSLIGVAVIVAAGLLAFSVLGAAWTDVVAFEHFGREPNTLAIRGGIEPKALSRNERRTLIGRLVAVYGVALIPIGIAVAIAAAFVADATYQEFLLPGQLGVPLVARIAARIPGPLLLVAFSVLLAEAIAGPASRMVLGRRFGLSAGRPSLGHVASRLPQMAALVIVAWSISLALVVPGIAAALLGWQAVRDLFLAPDALEGTESAVVAGGATLLFIFLWTAALLLAGLASALRAALWTTWSLAEFGPSAVTPEEPAPSS